MSEVDRGGGDGGGGVKGEDFLEEGGHVGGLRVEEEDAGAGVAVGVGEHLVDVGGGDVVARFVRVEAFVFGVYDEGEVGFGLEGEVGVELEMVAIFGGLVEEEFAGGLGAEGGVSQVQIGEDFGAVFFEEVGEEGFEEGVHVQEEVEGFELAVGEVRGVVGEEEAGEVECGLVAAVEAGDEFGGIGIGGDAVGGESDFLEEGAELVEELAIGGGGGLEEEAFGDEAEEAVEGVIEGEFVEGAGEAVLAVGAADLVGDAEFSTEEGEVVVEGLVVAVRGGVEFFEESGGEEMGEEFEPVVGVVVERGGVMEEGEIVGVGEEGEEVAGGFFFAVVFGFVGGGLKHFGEDLEGGVAEAEDADVLGGAEVDFSVEADFVEELFLVAGVFAVQETEMRRGRFEGGEGFMFEDGVRFHAEIVGGDGVRGKGCWGRDFWFLVFDF